MNPKKKIFKTVIAATCAMAFISLVYMLISAYSSNKSKMVIDVDTMELVQLEEPKDGDPIAIINTSLGEIRMVLYPQYSPNAVNNFTELAESGYYDNTYIFHSEDGAYSAGGAKNKDGTMPDGYDTSRELIERELNQNLWPFRGAVCAMNTTVDRGLKEMLFGGGTYYCGSRLAFVNSIEFTDEVKQELLDSSDSEELANAFLENGGIPNFSQQMTVIGQTYKGLDVIDALSNLETDDSENGTYKIPKEDIMIISVEISEYSEKDEENSQTEDNSSTNS